MREEGGVRRIGGSFLREREGIFEARFAGPAYERGFARGRLAYPLIAEGERELARTLETLVPSPSRRWLLEQLLAVTMRLSRRRFTGEELLEITGVSDGETPDPLPGRWDVFRRQFALHALHDFSQRFADTAPLTASCTGFAAAPPATRDGHVYLARTFDFEGGPRFDREKIVAAIVPDSGHAYLSVTFGGMTGVVSGMNEEGLALSLQSLTGGPTRLAGQTATLLAAEILRFESTVAGAIERIRSARVFVSDIFLLADAAGDMAAVEKTPLDCGVVRGAPLLGATNLARAEGPSKKVRGGSAGSSARARQARLDELLARHAGGIDAAAAAAILRDRRGVSDGELGAGNRNAIDAWIACHAVIFDATARRAWVAAAPHTLGPFVAFDLDLLARADPGDARFASLSAGSLPADGELLSGGFERYRAARGANLAARREALRGRWGAAREASDRALSLRPDFVEAMVAAAYIRARQAERAEALGLLARAAALDPGPPAFAREIARLREQIEAGRAPAPPAFPLSLADAIGDNRAP